MSDLRNYYIKTNRIFNPIRKYTWLVTVIVAIGGLWFPKLGLVVLGIMAALITTAFFNGRFWCGNVCPHRSLFDRDILPISRNGFREKLSKFFHCGVHMTVLPESLLSKRSVTR